MTNLVWTYLEVSATLTAFFIVYWLFLRKSTRFGLNRGFILGAILISVVVAFLPEPSTEVDSRIVWELNEVLVYEGQEQGVSMDTYSTAEIVKSVYYAGAGIIALFMVVGLIKIGLTLIRSRKEGGVWRSPAGGEIFSWFGVTMIPVDEEPSEEVIAHERAHVELAHSVDNLIAQLYCVVFWFNPVAWYFRRELSLVHEYQADERARHLLSDWQEYAKRVVAYALDTDPMLLGQSFSRRSELGRRLEMLRRSNSSDRWKGLRMVSIVFVIPLALAVQAFINPEKLDTGSDNAAVTYEKADVMPEYPGGFQELFTFIGANLKYTDEMLNAGLEEGKVYVGFTVDRFGNVTDVHIAKGLHPAFDETAKAVVSKMPNWTPGEINGKEVNVRMILPIKFKLN